MMTMIERSEAIGHAQRALKALSEHPRSSQTQLGHAREHLNACYSHGDSDQVWNAVAQVEAWPSVATAHRAPRSNGPVRPPTSRSLRQLPVAAMLRTVPFGRHRWACVELQGRLTTRPRDSLARSVDQWLVVKVGDGPRLVATGGPSE